MAARPRVVVIGAGSTGCALADELTERGWTDVTVLEQGPLFATDSPGMLFRIHADPVLTDFAKYTVAKYASLTLEGKWCFQPVGSLELATTPERLAELKRQHGWATSWGVKSYLRSPAECAQLHPLLDASRLLGGLHVPGDGVAKPLRAAEAQARRAIARGARFLGDQEVRQIERVSGRVTGVVTATDRFRADVVVSCAGPAVGALVELAMPMVSMAHQYAKSTPLAVLAGDNDDFTEAGKPLLRHEGLYVREHVDRLGIGSFAEFTDDPAGPVFAPEDFKTSWRAAVELMPVLGEAKIEDGVNGLSAMTPDGRPLLGEHPDLDGFWLAEAVWPAHSAGAARALAQWLVDGQARAALHGCDLARFDQVQLAPGYVRERSTHRFATTHDVVHPKQPPPGPRPLRTSPFYRRQADLGAYFGEERGWERPQWYAANENLPETAEVPARNEWAARFWSPVSGAEALVARRRVAMFDLTPSNRLEVTGPGALPFLQAMTTNQLDGPPGSVTYSLLLAENGGVRGDLVVARLRPQTFLANVNGPLDVDWLRRHLPGDGAVQIHETTPGTCGVGLWGPFAADVLESVVDGGLPDMPYATCRRMYVADVPVVALRLSQVGEPGWELYTTADLGRRLWDALWESGQRHGIVAAGREAFESLRLEEGRRAWGVDFSAEHDPYEAGLGFAVRPDKGYFLGRDALVGRSGATSVRRLVRLGYDDPYAVVLGHEPVYVEGRPAGYVTSAGYGYSMRKSLAYAWLPTEYTRPGTPVAIEYFGEKIPATVAS